MTAKRTRTAPMWDKRAKTQRLSKAHSKAKKEHVSRLLNDLAHRKDINV